MVASALDHRDCSGITDREPLAGNAAEVALTGNGAIQHRVADDDRLFRDNSSVRRRPHHDPAAGKSFAQIVVGVALKLEGDAARQKGAKTLTGSAGKARDNGVRWQAAVAVTFSDLAREHGAHGAVGILDWKGHPRRLATFELSLRLRDQLAVQDVADFVILPLAIVD